MKCILVGFTLAALSVSLTNSLRLSDLFFASRYPQYYNSFRDVNGDGLADVLPNSYVPVDVNGDGLADVVSPYAEIPLKNYAGIVYPPFDPRRVLSGPSRVGVDVNGDGLTDFVQRSSILADSNGDGVVDSVLPENLPYGTKGLDFDGDGVSDVSVSKRVPYSVLPNEPNICGRCGVVIGLLYCSLGYPQPCSPFLQANPEVLCKQLGIHPNCEALYRNIYEAKQVVSNSAVEISNGNICSALTLC